MDALSFYQILLQANAKPCIWKYRSYFTAVLLPTPSTGIMYCLCHTWPKGVSSIGPDPIFFAQQPKSPAKLILLLITALKRMR